MLEIKQAKINKYPDRYIDNGKGIIIDSFSNIMWQQDHSSECLSLTHSIHYAETCDLGGYTDWRLPGESELNLLSVWVFNNSEFANLIFIIRPGVFWTGTSYQDEPEYNTVVSFEPKCTHILHKDYSLAWVRLIRINN